MLLIYCKIALRSLKHYRVYTLLNVMGLTVGLIVSLLILLWVQDERQIDQFHAEGDRLYRILANLEDGGTIQTWDATPYPLIDYLTEHYPEIEAVGAYDPVNKKQFEFDDREVLADGIMANPGFFHLFSFPFVEGKIGQAFQAPKSVLLTKGLASSLFGQENVLGETIRINGQDHQVRGILEDVPAQSSLDFEFVLNLDEWHADQANSWPWGNYDTRIIVKLNPQAKPETFFPKIADALLQNNEYEKGISLIGQAFERTYLYGQFENGQEAGGRIEYVRLFGLAALFLLIIACINFMNLATARASRRSREVGVRKTIGATRKNLVTQFMLEAALITGVSLGLAMLLSEVALPYFESLSGKLLAFEYGSLSFWALVGGVGLFTALLAGSYPALFLSSFRITHVLRGKVSSNLGLSQVRRGLVVFQFVLSALLVVSALGVKSQVEYIRDKHLGLDKENVLYYRTPPGAAKQLAAYQAELDQLPGVRARTLTSTNPLSVGGQTGDPQWEGMAPGEGFLFNVIVSDHRFLSTLHIDLVQGRDFSPELSTDTTRFLVNETAARAMQMDEPLGKQLSFWGTSGPIIGVVKDFHIASLHEAIGPLIIANNPNHTGLTLLRIDPARTEEVIAAAKGLFDQFAEGYPFRYDFLDERYLQQYRSEERTGRLATWFAGIALFISCLGLLGLSAFMAEQKTKEIGIRKVLGASSLHILSLLSLDFLKLVALALVMALPLSWYLMNQWLDDFVYRVELSWWIFALTIGLALLVALLTVGFQSVKAALANPIDSLRSE